MKQKMIGMIGTIILVSATSSQAAVLYSSLTGAAGANSTIGTGNGSGKALNIVVEAGTDYTLDTIRLSLSGATLAELNAANLAIWSDDGTSAPVGTSLVGLSHTGTTVGNISEFAPDTAFTLVGGTTYWIAYNAYDANSGFSVNWQTFEKSVTAPIDSTAGLFRQGSPAGQNRMPQNWTGNSGTSNSLEVNATAVPEPSSALLSLLGGLALLRRRR